MFFKLQCLGIHKAIKKPLSNKQMTIYLIKLMKLLYCIFIVTLISDKKPLIEDIEGL
jgi:uncharacterized phage-associated protein